MLRDEFTDLAGRLRQATFPTREWWDHYVAMTRQAEETYGREAVASAIIAHFTKVLSEREASRGDAEASSMSTRPGINVEAP